MQINTTLIIESISINFYISYDCAGPLSATVELTGPVTINPGSYTTSDASSFNICQAYPGGCDSEWNSNNSIESTVTGNCSNIIAPGPNGYNVINASEDGGQGGVNSICPDTSDCGFSASYTDTLRARCNLNLTYNFNK